MALDIKKLTPGSTKFSRRILLYGDPGAGKTHFLGTAQDVPEMQDVLVVDIDGGSSTLLSRGDIGSIVARDAYAVQQLLWAMIQKDPQVANIKTLVLDGCSELQKRDLADIAAAAAAKPSERSKPRDADSNELLDYKINKTRMLRIFRMARDIPDITVIATCWARKTYPKAQDGRQKKDSMPTLVVPDLSDGINDTVMGAFDDCWYMFYDTATNTRNLVTSNYDVVRAKTRNQNIAKQLCNKDGIPILTSPDFATIFAAYKSVYQPDLTTKGA